MGVCNSCLVDVGYTSLVPKALPSKKIVRPLLADMQLEFARIAGEDKLFTCEELRDIWKQAAESKVGKLSDSDAALIEDSAVQYFAAMDADGGGTVTYEEFVAYMLGKGEINGPLQAFRKKMNNELRDNPDKLAALIEDFGRWDKNGDGFITPDELEVCLNECKSSLSLDADEDAKLRSLRDHIMEEADVDDDGRLDLWEFMAHALGRRKTPVELLLYDVSKGFAQALGPLVVGKTVAAVHSGIMVYGSEYWYGGKCLRTPPPCSKVFGKPLNKPWGEELERSEYMPELPVVRLGYTFVTHEEFSKWLKRQVVWRYSEMEQYDLLTHSCNHFSAEICKFLTGSDMPDRIFELQKMALTPTVLALRPFLNRYLGGFGEAGKEIDFRKDSNVEDANVGSPEDIISSKLGEGDLAMLNDETKTICKISKVEGDDGETCDISYYDAETGNVATKKGVRKSALTAVVRDS